MTFSVIIPAYQCRDTIRNTVESICLSGLEDYEIIIVDDGSADKTPEICKSIASQHDNVKYIRQENKGVSSARNLGIENAEGQYILFFDSDDSVDEGALAETVKIVKEQSPDLLIYGMSFDYYKNGEMYRRDLLVYPQKGLFTPSQWGELMKGMYEYNSLTPVWNKVFKKSLILNQVRFNPGYFIMEDFLFVLDYLKNCKNVYCLPEAIYRYRQSEDEANAYNRMKRVESLNDLMLPFENSMAAIKANNAYVKDEKLILAEMYYMLLEQKLFKADIKSIKKLSDEYNGSPFPAFIAEDCLNKYKRIHGYMINRNYFGVWLWYRYIQIRHKIAVMVKYLLHRH